jgi:hypothetical protein
VLKHCAANRKRQLSALPNVGPYIYDVKISGFIYIYIISRLRVNYGRKGRCTECIHKTQTKGYCVLESGFSKPLKYLIYFIGISLTFLNIKFFVAKLCECGGQPRPAN